MTSKVEYVRVRSKHVVVIVVSWRRRGSSDDCLGNRRESWGQLLSLLLTRRRDVGGRRCGRHGKERSSFSLASLLAFTLTVLGFLLELTLLALLFGNTLLLLDDL